MGNIHILDTEVSNKIAAGEVVERPLSIVKELVENSIDAGANVITVEIKDGGISYIRVSDNGSGMGEDDAKICFLRHATSKISKGSDLDAIYTLGFRGEALSSIGAVAKVKLYTKERDAQMGILVTCEGGEILSSSDSGVPDGTILEVSDLFYNTPARKKFLKKPSVEGGYIADLMGRYVFAHPEISFKLIRDGKEVIFSSGDNNIINAVYSVYGKDYAKNMLEVNYEYNGIKVTGLIGKGTLTRSNRNYETFLVNKRYIKSAILIRAVEEAYKNQIMIAKFPTAILNIDIPAESVDINVHPTKLECKFSDDHEIYQAVYHAVKSTLYALPNIPSIDHSPVVKPEKHELTDRSLEDIFREKVRESEKKKEEENTSIRPPVPDREYIILEEPKKEEMHQKFMSSITQEQDMMEDQFLMIDYAKERLKHSNSLMVNTKSGEKPRNDDPVEDWKTYLKRVTQVRNQTPQPIETATDDNLFHGNYFRVIGQVFDTYILVEKEDNLLMIDQHAAHERLNYESLKEQIQNTGVMSQMILEPIEIKLHPSELAIYELNKEEFPQLGFECSLDGDVLSVTAIPTDVSWSDAEPLFIELLSQMDELKMSVMSEKKERLLYTISCKAAIKANMKVSDLEMQTLVRKVFALENINTCPHGRPIVISMTKKQIEKDFKRIV